LTNKIPCDIIKIIRSIRNKWISSRYKSR